MAIPRCDGSFPARKQCGGRERGAFLASDCKPRFAGFAVCTRPIQHTSRTRPRLPRRRVFFFEEPILNTLNVEYRKVEALIPYARNPRTHTDEQVAKIAASIVEYGWTNPVLAACRTIPRVKYRIAL